MKTFGRFKIALMAAALTAAVFLIPASALATSGDCIPPSGGSSVTSDYLADICYLLKNGAAAKSQAYTSSVTLTRTNDTNAYAANDVIGAATGSTAALTFSSIGPSAGGEVMITSARFEIDASAVISGEGSYILYLYNVTPPSALGDNAAWDVPSGDRNATPVTINLGTPVDLGSTLLVETDIINKQVTVPPGGALYGYLVTVGAHTPTASRVYRIMLKAVGL